MNASEALERLCRRLRASDRAAFEEVFRLFRDDLLRYVYAIVRDDGDAHDLVQDVFVSLWSLRESLDPARSLRAYLYRMARNRAYRHLRDARLHVEKQPQIAERLRPSVPEAPGDRHDADLLGRRLSAWIEALPERQREAFVLSRFHGLSHHDIAAVMEISPRTVNNHIMRALEHLQACIEAFEPVLLEES